MHKEKAAERGNVHAARECKPSDVNNTPGLKTPQEHLDAAARLLVASVWLSHDMKIGDQARTRDAYRRARDLVNAMAPYLDGGAA